MLAAIDAPTFLNLYAQRMKKMITYHSKVDVICDVIFSVIMEEAIVIIICIHGAFKICKKFSIDRPIYLKYLSFSIFRLRWSLWRALPLDLKSLIQINHLFYWTSPCVHFSHPVLVISFNGYKYVLVLSLKVAVQMYLSM